MFTTSILKKKKKRKEEKVKKKKHRKGQKECFFNGTIQNNLQIIIFLQSAFFTNQMDKQFILQEKKKREIKKKLSFQLSPK